MDELNDGHEKVLLAPVRLSPSLMLRLHHQQDVLAWGLINFPSSIYYKIHRRHTQSWLLSTTTIVRSRHSTY